MNYDVPLTVHTDSRAALSWLRENWPDLQSRLHRTGWVLCRGLPFRTSAELAAVREAVCLTPFRPTEIFSPREDLGDEIVSPIRWPADRQLCPYTEHSYATEFPGVIMMLCAQAARTGGETLLADTRRIIQLLPAELASRFIANGWLMTRVFRPDFGMGWAEAFSVFEPGELESCLARNSISHSWLPGGVLRTSRTLPAVIRHPWTGDLCWFNQAAFLSEWSLETTERAVLLRAFGPEGLPVNTGFGDGESLASQDVQSIHNAHEDLIQEVSWQTGDLLIVDNIAVARGRRPYQGNRHIHIALAEPAKARPGLVGHTISHY